MGFPKHYRKKQSDVPALHQTINAGGIYVPSSCLNVRASSEHSNAFHNAEDVLNDETTFEFGVADKG